MKIDPENFNIRDIIASMRPGNFPLTGPELIDLIDNCADLYSADKISISRDEFDEFVGVTQKYNKRLQKRENKIAAIREAKRIAFNKRQLATRREPPRVEMFLFSIIAPPNHCSSMMGDIEEEYHSYGKKFGERLARFWMWGQLMKSFGPLIWAALIRIGIVLLSVSGLDWILKRF